VLRSAAAELVQALASLSDDTGVVLIDGFHHDIVPLSDAQVEAAQAIPPPVIDADAPRPNPYPPGVGPAELGVRLTVMPTANISAVQAGDAENEATVVPGKARANVDF